MLPYLKEAKKIENKGQRGGEHILLPGKIENI